MTYELITILLTAGITGAVSTLSTVAALRVHIRYIGDRLARHDDAIIRAHDRIDTLNAIIHNATFDKTRGN